MMAGVCPAFSILRGCLQERVQTDDGSSEFGQAVPSPASPRFVHTLQSWLVGRPKACFVTRVSLRCPVAEFSN